jgi:hypothetical protein
VLFIAVTVLARCHYAFILQLPCVSIPKHFGMQPIEGRVGPKALPGSHRGIADRKVVAWRAPNENSEMFYREKLLPTRTESDMYVIMEEDEEYIVALSDYILSSKRVWHDVRGLGKMQEVRSPSYFRFTPGELIYT